MAKNDMKWNNANLENRFWEFIVTIYDKNGVKEVEMETSTWQMRTGSDCGPEWKHSVAISYRTANKVKITRKNVITQIKIFKTIKLTNQTEKTCLASKKIFLHSVHAGRLCIQKEAEILWSLGFRHCNRFRPAML